MTKICVHLQPNSTGCVKMCFLETAGRTNGWSRFGTPSSSPLSSLYLVNEANATSVGYRSCSCSRVLEPERVSLSNEFTLFELSTLPSPRTGCILQWLSGTLCTVVLRIRRCAAFRQTAAESCCVVKGTVHQNQKHVFLNVRDTGV